MSEKAHNQQHLRALEASGAERNRHRTEIRHNLELDLLSGIIADPGQILCALELVAPADMVDPRHKALLGQMADMYRSGLSMELWAVADELDRRGLLDQAGGPLYLAEIFDGATGALVLNDARRLRRMALEDRTAEVCRDLEGVTDAAAIRAAREKLEQLEAELAGSDGAVNVRSLGFSGDRLRDLRSRPEAESPLPGILDPEPHLHVLQGKTKTGKTTFALALARAWCGDLPPWPGAPSLPGSRVLVISREQPVVRLDAMLRRLSVGAEQGSIEGVTDSITLVGRDPDLDAQGKRLLCLDDAGLATLRTVLRQAHSDGEPFGLVLLDSISRLKPLGIEENNNDAMTAWLDALEEIAVECGVYILLIHHVGHSTNPSRQEPRSAGRGASAIAAVAQATWLLERVPRFPNQRLLKVDGNALLPSEVTFEVCGENAEPGSIHYFRPCHPLDAYDIDQLLKQDEEINTSTLARRIDRKEPKTGKRPPGMPSKTARALRLRWLREGLIETFAGPKNAKMMRRKNAQEAERA